MIGRIRAIRPLGKDRGDLHSTYQELIVMKWETPQAVDFRFGMEITMYIAKR